MSSYKSKIFNFIVKNGHLLQGNLKKELFDMNTSIPGFRERCEKGAKRYSKIPKGIEIKEQIIEGIKSEWIIPAGADSDKIILYVHGGGYVSGSCSDHRGFVLKFAKSTRVKILMYEYSLAPGNAYPAALERECFIVTHYFAPMFREATEEMNEIVEFVNIHLRVSTD